MPISFLQEKIEELHIYKDKSREPDWAHGLQTFRRPQMDKKPKTATFLSEFSLTRVELIPDLELFLYQNAIIYIYIGLCCFKICWDFFFIWFCRFFIFTYLGLTLIFMEAAFLL